MRYVVNLMLQLHLFATSMRTVLLSCADFCIRKDDGQLALDTHDLVQILIWFREVHEGTVDTPCEQIRAIWARASSSLPRGIKHLKGDRGLELVIDFGLEADQQFRRAEQVASMFMRELGPAKEVDKATFDMLLEVDPMHCKDCGMCLPCHAKEVNRAVREAQRSVRVLMRAIAAYIKSLHRRQKRAEEDPPRRSVAGAKRGRDKNEWERGSGGGGRSVERREWDGERNGESGFDRYSGRDQSFDGREGERRVRRRYR